MFDLYKKNYIRDVKHVNYINESFPSSEKALDMVSGQTKYTKINKILDILHLTIKDQNKTNMVIKRLKSLGMEDDEINELRDVYIKIYKNSLDKTIKKNFYVNGEHDFLNKFYIMDKTLFGLYKFDDFIKHYTSNIDMFIKELNSVIAKDFKYTYEKRLKNRQYGKLNINEGIDRYDDMNEPIDNVNNDMYNLLKLLKKQKIQVKSFKVADYDVDAYINLKDGVSINITLDGTYDVSTYDGRIIKHLKSFPNVNRLIQFLKTYK